MLAADCELKLPQTQREALHLMRSVRLTATQACDLVPEAPGGRQATAQRRWALRPATDPGRPLSGLWSAPGGACPPLAVRRRIAARMERGCWPAALHLVACSRPSAGRRSALSVRGRLAWLPPPLLPSARLQHAATPAPSLPPMLCIFGGHDCRARHAGAVRQHPALEAISGRGAH